MGLASAPTQPENDRVPAFNRYVRESLGAPLYANGIQTVQMNIGLECNLACRHCHVESSPKRREAMDWETMLAILEVVRRTGAKTLDITGGAPEMHPLLCQLINAAKDLHCEVMVRTNLTILLQEGYQHFPGYFAEQRVHLIASLPCYLSENVDKQRGRHVHRDSIAAIQQLNLQGYGRESGKLLDLVYNPQGPALPPHQKKLEEDYRLVLHDEFGIVFNSLYAITNMPIGRFARDLEKMGQREAYEQLLRKAFNPLTLEGLMCRSQVHVGWDGQLYDCDFNFALGLSIADAGNVRELKPMQLERRRIVTGEHCFACTAGCGSSCGGVLI